MTKNGGEGCRKEKLIRNKVYASSKDFSRFSGLYRIHFFIVKCSQSVSTFSVNDFQVLISPNYVILHVLFDEVSNSVVVFPFRDGFLLLQIEGFSLVADCSFQS